MYYILMFTLINILFIDSFITFTFTLNFVCKLAAVEVTHIKQIRSVEKDELKKKNELIRGGDVLCTCVYEH